MGFISFSFIFGIFFLVSLLFLLVVGVTQYIFFLFTLIWCIRFQDHIPAEELASAIGGGVGQQLQNQPLQQSVMALTCHECFRSVLESWLITARSKVMIN